MAQSHHNNQRHSTTSTHELLDHEPDHGHHFKLQTTHTERVTSPTPPDGDPKGWIQCAASFCLWFVGWGMVNSFGCFQAYYEEAQLKDHSPSSISWIGSLQLCLFIVGTVIVGPIFDRGYLRPILVTGTVFTTASLLLTSVCVKYWQFILAQGIGTGVGMTFLFIPSISIIPMYFTNKRSLAMGLAATGSSIGAIVVSTLFQRLVHTAGFGWTVRVIGFLLLLILLFPISVLRSCTSKASPRSFVDVSAFKEWPFIIVLDYGLCPLELMLIFWWQMVHMAVAQMSCFIPFFYVQSYANANHVLDSSSSRLGLVNYLIIIMNSGSFLGRLAPNMLADKLGPFNTAIPIVFLTSASAFAWLAVTPGPSIIAFCVVYGFFSGAYIALVPVIWANLCPTPQVLGTRMGMMTVPTAAGMLIGTPIAGTLVHGADFKRLQIFAGITMAAAGILLLGARVAKVGWDLSVKV